MVVILETEVSLMFYTGKKLSDWSKVIKNYKINLNQF